MSNAPRVAVEFIFHETEINLPPSLRPPDRRRICADRAWLGGGKNPRYLLEF